MFVDKYLSLTMNHAKKQNDHAWWREGLNRLQPVGHHIINCHILLPLSLWNKHSTHFACHYIPKYVAERKKRNYPSTHLFTHKTCRFEKALHKTSKLDNEIMSWNVLCIIISICQGESNL